MNASERMAAAIALKPVDRFPNAPFQEAPICRYFGRTFRSALLEDQDMADCHMEAIETFQFDWVMVGMGLIGGIIPEAMGCTVSWPEDVFPVIEKTTVFSIEDVARIAESDVYTKRMDRFLEGISILKNRLKGEVPIACEYISPFTIATRLRGTNEIMLDIYKNPELVRSLQEAIVPLDIEIGKALIDAGVDYIFYGADMESAMMMTTAALSGADVSLHTCGTYGSMLAMSFEKFIADEDLCGALKKLMKPVEFNEDAFAMELIKEAGTSGNYLMQTHTLKRCRIEFFEPDLSTRTIHAKWEQMGVRDMDKRAGKVLESRLNSYEKPDIDPQLEQDLKQFVGRRKKSPDFSLVK